MNESSFTLNFAVPNSSLVPPELRSENGRGHWKSERWLPPHSEEIGGFQWDSVWILLTWNGHEHVQVHGAKFHRNGYAILHKSRSESLFSLLESKGEVTVGDVNESFDGNICRCTGYRPILDAFKSFAVDAPKDLLKCGDIEVMVPEVLTMNTRNHFSSF